MNHSEIELAATMLWNAASCREAIAPLRDAFPGMSADDAYAVQNANTERRLASGARLVGRKIGLTARAVQRQLGDGVLVLQRRLTADVTDGARHRAGHAPEDQDRQRQQDHHRRDRRAGPLDGQVGAKRAALEHLDAAPAMGFGRIDAPGADIRLHVAEARLLLQWRGAFAGVFAVFANPFGDALFMAGLLGIGVAVIIS